MKYGLHQPPETSYEDFESYCLEHSADIFLRIKQDSGAWKRLSLDLLTDSEREDYIKNWWQARQELKANQAAPAPGPALADPPDA